MLEAILSAEQRQLREQVRDFVRSVPRQLVLDMDAERVRYPRGYIEDLAAQRLLGMRFPPEYGGRGLGWCDEIVALEEIGVLGTSLACLFSLPSIVGEALNVFGTPEQKERWLPGVASGDTVLAIAMTEPGTGSDLAAVQTTAIRDGDEYVVNGSKTFITNGGHADRVLVVAKTDPKASHAGISLIMVDADSEGFSRGPQIEKLGQHASDTTELFFDDVRVPAENLVGAEGTGFIQLMEKLVPERMIIAVGALSAAEAAFEITLDYVKERTAFGRPIGSFQNSRFKMAEIKTELTVGRAFVDQCIEKHVNGELTIEEAAMAKWWTTELLGKVTDECLQLHGGYGYTNEYAISRAWVDARITRIYGGTTEIMKELIGRGMGL